jgi:hypothetical protein
MDVLSVHVPKTAGSTFGNLLTAIYGRDRVYKDYDDYPMNPLSRCHVDPEGWRELARAQVGSIGPEFAAVHGHFAVEKYRGAFPEARRIAWVRHPVAWVTSLYWFWKSARRDDPGTTNPLIHRLLDEDLSLVEFASDPSVRDRVSGTFLAGVEPGDVFFLGIQEQFDDEIRDLVRMMGWPPIAAGFENRNPGPCYGDRSRQIHEDRRLRDQLIALNPGDMALYEEAIHLRARRAGAATYFTSDAA